jgi:hypothetical protein
MGLNLSDFGKSGEDSQKHPFEAEFIDTDEKFINKFEDVDSNQDQNNDRGKT